MNDNISTGLAGIRTSLNVYCTGVFLRIATTLLHDDGFFGAGSRQALMNGNAKDCIHLGCEFHHRS